MSVRKIALILAVARAFSRRHDVDAMVSEDALEQGHVGEPRHVVEDQRLIGQQSSRHQRQGSVLRP